MKKRYGVILTLIIFALVYFVLRGVDFGEVVRLLREINLVWFGLAFLAYGISFLLWNLRFRNSLKKLCKCSYGFLLSVLFAGIFINTVTPGSNVGGEPVRAYYLSRKNKKSKTKFLGAILADKLFNIIMFSIFLVFSILFVVFFVGTSFDLNLIWIIVVGLVLLGIIVWFVVLNKKTGNVFRWMLKRIYDLKFANSKFVSFGIFERYIRKRIRNMKNSFVEIFRDRWSVSFGLGISFLIWIFVFLGSYFLFFAFGNRVSFVSVIVVVSLSYLIGDVSPVPGGIGLVESSMFLLYLGLGVSGSLAVAVALLSRAIYYCYALGVGGLSLVYLRFRFR